MNASIVKGRVAGVPYGKTVVNIDAADAAALIGATTGLVKTVARAGAAGAGVVLGLAIVSDLISGLTQGLSSEKKTSKLTTVNPRLTIGSAPCLVETSSGQFWGIILDQDFDLKVHKRILSIPYTQIHKIECRQASGWIWSTGEFRISTLGGKYQGYEPGDAWPVTRSIQIATVGGFQSVPIKSTPKRGERLVSVKLSSPKMAGIEALRENLKYVLQNNGSQITNLIGANLLQTFFNVSGIP
jgi:hypothetical protein